MKGITVLMGNMAVHFIFHNILTTLPPQPWAYTTWGVLVCILVFYALLNSYCDGCLLCYIAQKTGHPRSRCQSCNRSSTVGRIIFFASSRLGGWSMYWLWPHLCLPHLAMTFSSMYVSGSQPAGHDHLVGGQPFHKDPMSDILHVR